MLEFDQEAHRYTWHGKPVPHVTGILSPLTSYDRIPEHVLKHAQDEGVAIHKMVELDCYGDLDVDALPAWMAGHYAAWRQFLADTGFEFIASEHRVFHPEYCYAGTLDLAGYLKHTAGANGISIIDVKRSFFAGPAIGAQIAAYAEAWNKAHPKTMVVKSRYALQLKADGAYRLEAFEDKSDFSVFLACLTLYNWRSKHGK